MNLGLFYALDQNAVVENLTLSNFNLNTGGNVGVVAPTMTGSPTLNSVNGTGTLQGAVVGGLIGNGLGATSLMATLSTFAGTINATSFAAGGLVADGYYLTFTSCSANVNITVNLMYAHAAGLVGYTSNTNVQYSSTAGTITNPNFSGNLGGLLFVSHLSFSRWMGFYKHVVPTFRWGLPHFAINFRFANFA